MRIIKISLLLFLIALASYALFLYSRPAESYTELKINEIETADEEPIAQTRLFFSPSAQDLNRVSEVPIMIQTGNNAVKLVQIELQYDPTHMQVLDIQPAGFFPEPRLIFKEHIVNRGTIHLAFENSETSITGSGELAIITLMPVHSASSSAVTQVKFMPKTAVRDASERESVLLSTEDLLLEIPAMIASSSGQ